MKLVEIEPAKPAAGVCLMCLAIPGKLLSRTEHDGLLFGTVQFGGITREIGLMFVPEAVVGDYVLVHVGMALTRTDEKAAARELAMFEEMGILPELKKEFSGDDDRER